MFVKGYMSQCLYKYEYMIEMLSTDKKRWKSRPIIKLYVTTIYMVSLLNT